MTTTFAARTTNRRALVLALVIVAILLTTALVGTEAYARHQLSRCISTQFEKGMGSTIDVGFGLKPMLISYFDGKVPSMTVDSKDNKFGPAVGMVVHAHFHDIEITDSGAAGSVIGSSSADIIWSNDGIGETLGGLVSGVSSSAASAMLTMDVLGPLAQLQLHPQVQNGAVEVQTESAQLLGMGLPTDLVQGIVDVLTQSLQSYPFGMQATNVTVTDNGVAVQLAGGRSELVPPSSGSSNSTRC